MICHGIDPGISGDRVWVYRVRHGPLIDHGVLFSLISIFYPSYYDGVLGSRFQILNFSLVDFERNRLALGAHVTGNLDFGELHTVLVSLLNGTPSKLKSK